MLFLFSGKVISSRIGIVNSENIFIFQLLGFT